jgi:hypothetical protein
MCIIFIHKTFSYLYDWNRRCISCNSKDVKCSSIVFIYYYSLPRSFHGTLYKHVFLGKTMNEAEMSSQWSNKLALAWWLVPCLPFPGLPHIYFLFAVRLTNERVGVFLARRSVQHLVILSTRKENSLFVSLSITFNMYKIKDLQLIQSKYSMWEVQILKLQHECILFLVYIPEFKQQLRIMK